MCSTPGVDPQAGRLDRLGHPVHPVDDDLGGALCLALYGGVHGFSPASRCSRPSWDGRSCTNLAALCQRFHKLLGWLSTVNGIGTAVYTGLVIQSFPAVALWHNPGVPLLFTVSAFSTALAFLLLVLTLVIKREEDHHIRVFYERTDLMLIATELVILFSFFQYMRAGSESAFHSAQLLWNDWGWMIGFIGFGLIVPFMLELKGVLKGWSSHVPIVTASVLVLVGGYLLRHYFMYTGVYAQPW